MTDSAGDVGSAPRVEELSETELKIKNARFDAAGNPFGNEDADRRTTVRVDEIDGIACVVVRADVDHLVSAHAEASIDGGGGGFGRDGSPRRTDDVQVAVPLKQLRQLVGARTEPTACSSCGGLARTITCDECGHKDYE